MKSRFPEFLLFAAALVSWGCTNGASVGANANRLLDGNQIVGAAPTASLSVALPGAATGGTDIEVDVADMVNFTWSSTGGDQAQSWYTIDSPDTCVSSAGGTGPFPWSATTLSGNTTEQMMTCRAGHVYTVTYLVQDSHSGLMVSTKVTIKVRPL